MNFGIIGAAGYIAPRHMQAVGDLGHRLVAACDPNDSVGIMDRYSPECAFFTEPEMFERYIDNQRRSNSENRLDYLAVCSPNYLHDAHIQIGLRNKCHVICEKPLATNIESLDTLAAMEQEHDKKVFTILQLRLLPSLIEVKKEVENKPKDHKPDVTLSYITRRGPWYHASWKGQPEKSGGVGLNIGIHFFDLMMWIFGDVENYELHLSEKDKMGGFIELENARVRWFLSVDKDDLPDGLLEKGTPAFRSLTMDGKELEFSGGFTDLHTRSYEQIIAGNGYGLDEARPAVDLVTKLSGSQVKAGKSDLVHPLVGGR